jgi:hypothetical protein
LRGDDVDHRQELALGVRIHLPLEWCDATFEFAAKRSQVDLHGLNFDFKALNARLEISKSPVNTIESGSHLVAEFRRVVPIRSYLDGDNVEELQNLRFAFHPYRAPSTSSG